jgi:hypothetical protein
VAFAQTTVSEGTDQHAACISAVCDPPSLWLLLKQQFPTPTSTPRTRENTLIDLVVVATIDLLLPQLTCTVSREASATSDAVDGAVVKFGCQMDAWAAVELEHEHGDAECTQPSLRDAKIKLQSESFF